MTTAAKFGNYCALIGISIILLLHYSGTSAFFTKGIGSLASSFVEIIFIFLAIRATRDKDNGGYLDFRNCARAGATMVLINAILFTLFYYLYFQLIDITFVQDFLPDYEKWSKLAGKSDEEIKQTGKLLFEGFTPISAAWSSFSQTVFFETIIVLIAARILRRNPPEHPAVA